MHNARAIIHTAPARPPRFLSSWWGWLTKGDHDAAKLRASRSAAGVCEDCGADEPAEDGICDRCYVERMAVP